MAKKRDALDDFDGDYIGNMWGWKFSMFSLALILILSAFIAFQYYKTGKFPMPEQYEKERQMMMQDSLNQEK
jgi:predicted MFS family arabinose efflux permease